MGAFKSRTIVIDNHITCTKCGETKDTRFFSRIKESNSFRSTCTQCRMGSPTSRYKKQDQVLELYNNGFKECAICYNTFGETKNTRANVDHCHESTKVRMLLCGRCNLTLGLFNDNINTLHSAINYLQKYHDDTTIEYYI